MSRVTFHVEPFSHAVFEARALIDEHDVELNARRDVRNVKLDMQTYLAAEINGQLHTIVAREDGAMVGYFVSFIVPHKHYADTLCSFEDLYFLTKEHRKGLTGYRLIAEWKRLMKERGDVKELYAMTKVAEGHDASPLFERLGFQRTDYLFRQWIGD
jgi:GNAT superfamily N-acetyltransferase